MEKVLQNHPATEVISEQDTTLLFHIFLENFTRSPDTNAETGGGCWFELWPLNALVCYHFISLCPSLFTSGIRTIITPPPSFTGPKAQHNNMAQNQLSRPSPCTQAGIIFHWLEAYGPAHQRRGSKLPDRFINYFLCRHVAVTLTLLVPSMFAGWKQSIIGVPDCGWWCPDIRVEHIYCRKYGAGPGPKLQSWYRPWMILLSDSALSPWLLYNARS